MNEHQTESPKPAHRDRNKICEIVLAVATLISLIDLLFMLITVGASENSIERHTLVTQQIDSFLLILLVCVIVGSMALFRLLHRSVARSIVNGFIIGLFFMLILNSFDQVLNGDSDVPIRARVVRAKQHMNKYTEALKAYQADHAAWPAWTEKTEEKEDWQSKEQAPTFSRHTPTGPATLTTPVAYLTEESSDPFVRDEEKRAFAYWVAPDGAHWVLWSPGPDMHFDLDRTRLDQLFSPNSTSRPASWISALIPYTYDPSNGTVSAGDIWRASE